MTLRRQMRNLGDRRRRPVDESRSSDGMVSADPIRMFLHRWIIETGDPVEIIAKGFGLDQSEVSEILSGNRSRIRGRDDRRLRERLGLDAVASGPKA